MVRSNLSLKFVIMLGGDLYSRVMLTDNDITEADIAGFVKQILSGKKLQKGILTRF